MPKFGTFKFGQEKFGKKPPRHAHLPTRTQPAFGIPLFGHCKFGQVKFGDRKSVEMLTAEQGPIILGAQSKKAAGRRIIYRRRNGKQQQYKYVKPGNPQTESQQTHRQEYKNAYLSWKALPEAEKDTWNKKAEGTTITGYNLFMKEEMKK